MIQPEDECAGFGGAVKGSSGAFLQVKTPILFLPPYPLLLLLALVEEAALLPAVYLLLDW